MRFRDSRSAKSWKTR